MYPKTLFLSVQSNGRCDITSIFMILHILHYSTTHHNFITCCYFCVCRCSVRSPSRMMWGSRGSFSSQFSLLRYEIGSNVLLVARREKESIIWKWKYRVQYEKMNGPFCKITGLSISLIIKVGGDAVVAGDQADYSSPKIQKDYCIRRNILWSVSQLINLILYFISVAIFGFYNAA